jgi:dihydrofolate reductase
MRIAMMMAMDRARLIGRANGLPWHLPEDLRHFKSVTMGKPIVMGRATWDSIGRPLPGRANIVVTRQADWRATGAIVVHSLDEAFSAARAAMPDADELVVIGGATLCRAAMPLTERLYLTLIDAEFDGDTWLDSYCEEDWRETARETYRSPDGHDYHFLQLQRLAA